LPVSGNIERLDSIIYLAGSRKIICGDYLYFSLLSIRDTSRERIKELRKIKGLTQEELGEIANLSYKFVGELERGKVNVSLDSLDRITRALGISMGDLFSPGSAPVIKIKVKESNPLSKLSSDNLATIRKALKLLNKTFTAS